MLGSPSLLQSASIRPYFSSLMVRTSTSPPGCNHWITNAWLSRPLSFSNESLASQFRGINSDQPYSLAQGDRKAQVEIQIHGVAIDHLGNSLEPVDEGLRDTVGAGGSQ
jgi:hypothetical protein